jgi:hypothetical protein
MPITQERLLRLVEAAEAYEQSYNGITDAAKTLLMNYPHAMESQAFSELFASIFAFAPGAEAQRRLASERQHYNLTNKRNERKAAYARRKRGPPLAELDESTLLASLEDMHTKGT